MPLPNPTELGPMLISWCFLWRCHALSVEASDTICRRAWSTDWGEAQVLGVHASWLKACVLQRVKWPLRFKRCWDPCICLWDSVPFTRFSCPQMIHSCQCPQYLDGVRTVGPLGAASGKLGGHFTLPLSMEEIGAYRSIFWHQVVPPGKKG